MQRKNPCSTSTTSNALASSWCVTILFMQLTAYFIVPCRSSPQAIIVSIYGLSFYVLCTFMVLWRCIIFLYVIIITIINTLGSSGLCTTPSLGWWKFPAAQNFCIVPHAPETSPQAWPNSNTKMHRTFSTRKKRFMTHAFSFLIHCPAEFTETYFIFFRESQFENGAFFPSSEEKNEILYLLFFLESWTKRSTSLRV